MNLNECEDYTISIFFNIYDFTIHPWISDKSIKYDIKLLSNILNKVKLKYICGLYNKQSFKKLSAVYNVPHNAFNNCLKEIEFNIYYNSKLDSIDNIILTIDNNENIYLFDHSYKVSYDIFMKYAPLFKTLDILLDTPFSIKLPEPL